VSDEQANIFALGLVRDWKAISMQSLAGKGQKSALRAEAETKFLCA
jgi:hypothetical protein